MSLDNLVGRTLEKIDRISLLFNSNFLYKISISFKNVHKTDIAYIDIAVEMLLTAWFPHQYFKLSLGT